MIDTLIAAIDAGELDTLLGNMSRSSTAVMKAKRAAWEYGVGSAYCSPTAPFCR
ncbi:hypothetical protein [Terrarubrum flagellatum]|uniref:hypothetical protein n=1 Tax=Terrirubrum flagellatum TaxID=2895980 RepID=UPI003145690D